MGAVLMDSTSFGSKLAEFGPDVKRGASGVPPLVALMILPSVTSDVRFLRTKFPEPGNLNYLLAPFAVEIL